MHKYVENCTKKKKSLLWFCLNGAGFPVKKLIADTKNQNHKNLKKKKKPNSRKYL